jgi:cation-transporting ATPase E
MTGDGVNDILALREADCSIAMAAGSEAARNVSHLVLLDNNFASMPKVVTQGRRVINNIQKASSMFLFKTLFVMLIVCFCIITKMVYPFEPINMLLIEFFIIGAPAFFIALEINDRQIKGKFLLSVLRNAFSGAIVVLFNVLVLFLLKNYGQALFEIDDETFTTLMIFMTTIIALENRPTAQRIPPNVDDSDDDPNWSRSLFCKRLPRPYATRARTHDATYHHAPYNLPIDCVRPHAPVKNSA